MTEVTSPFSSTTIVLEKDVSSPLSSTTIVLEKHEVENDQISESSEDEDHDEMALKLLQTQSQDEGFPVHTSRKFVFFKLITKQMDRARKAVGASVTALNFSKLRSFQNRHSVPPRQYPLKYAVGDGEGDNQFISKNFDSKVLKDHPLEDKCVNLDNYKRKLVHALESVLEDMTMKNNLRFRHCNDDPVDFHSESEEDEKPKVKKLSRDSTPFPHTIPIMIMIASLALALPLLPFLPNRLSEWVEDDGFCWPWNLLRSVQSGAFFKSLLSLFSEYNGATVVYISTDFDADDDDYDYD